MNQNQDDSLDYKFFFSKIIPLNQLYISAQNYMKKRGVGCDIGTFERI